MLDVPNACVNMFPTVAFTMPNVQGYQRPNKHMQTFKGIPGIVLVHPLRSRQLHVRIVQAILRNGAVPFPTRQICEEPANLSSDGLAPIGNVVPNLIRINLRQCPRSSPGIHNANCSLRFRRCMRLATSQCFTRIWRIRGEPA